MFRQLLHKLNSLRSYSVVIVYICTDQTFAAFVTAPRFCTARIKLYGILLNNCLTFSYASEHVFHISQVKDLSTDDQEVRSMRQ